MRLILGGTRTINSLRLMVLAGLSLAFLGCAEAPVKDEPAELAPQDIMYEQRQKIQQQMMQGGRPVRIGPGRR